jgi:hypothetical protein
VSRLSLSVLVLLPLVGVLAGCESSQGRSARLQREGAKLILNQRGLVVHGVNRTIRVLQAGVVTDANGTAAALVLRNLDSKPSGSVPIAIDVVDPKGKSVFANTAPGLESSLVSVASLPPRRDVTWVDDQVIPTGAASSVRARIGAGGGGAPTTLPQIDVGPPHFITDPTSGVEATGTVTNRSSVEQVRLFVYLSAWQGGRLLAAGRGAVARLAAHAHASYHVFLIGDPHGARLTAIAPATVLR